ncbi:MAG: hypothetical protein ACJAUG_000601 [Halioglobus sp.]|jgi:hypothetical protein
MHKRQQALLTDAPPLIASYIIGYFRWTQLTPMIFAWGFLLLALLLLSLLSFQELSTELGIRWSQITAGIFKLWGYFSLFLLLLDIVYRQVFKREATATPSGLPRKLIICALAITAVIALLFANYYFGNVMNDDDDPRLYFVGAGALVWLISAYSLTVSHLLGRLSDKVMQAKN